MQKKPLLMPIIEFIPKKEGFPHAKTPQRKGKEKKRNKKKEKEIKTKEIKEKKKILK
jgi:hypothetical protein